jgi:NAD(P)-dependent dehydrogenase (short-subunit alcohol dehydrogenase family)
MKPPVLLTGAAGDIGAAILAQLHSAGYGVIGLDKIKPRNEDRFLEFFTADLTNCELLSQTCSEIREEYSPLWALVHCAGIYPIVPISSYTSDLWDEVQSVNLKSAFQIVQQLHSEISDGGRIVFISSGAAHIGSRDVGYSTSKAGLIGLARSLAKTFAPRILVNSVCPGLISSPMSARMTSEHFSRTLEAVPLKRPGVPEEISVCVSFLLDQQNSYMTGSTIDVNGGLYMR